DHSEAAFRRGTNVIPRQFTPQQLQAGCAELMRDLYEPDAYFERLDGLYLERGLRPGRARTRYLRRRPARWLAVNARLLAEALAPFVPPPVLASPQDRRQFGRLHCVASRLPVGLPCRRPSVDYHLICGR